MKIWIVSVGEPLPTDGENTRLRRMGNFAQCAVDHGHVVEWFSVSFDHYGKKQRCNADLDININSNYIMHLLYVNSYKRNVSLKRVYHHVSAARRIYHKMKELEKPDFMILSMEPLEVSYISSKFAYECSIPFVIDVRDLWPEIYYEVVPDRLKIFLKPYIALNSYILKYSMSKATAIIGLSKGFLEYGLKYAGRKARTADAVFPISYPNYNYAEYKPLFSKYWSSYGLKQNDFIAVFFGNFGKQFDFNAIIDASHRLSDYPDIKLILCGTGEQGDVLKNKAAKNVIFPGWIEKEQILSLAANASIGLAPYIDSMNYTLNTPNKFGEYLSAGLPILTRVSGIMEDLLLEFDCGCRYTDGESLARFILRYRNDPPLLRSHSRNARKLYDKHFNGDTAYQKLLEYCIMICKEYGAG